eukprot:64483-Chlamydomonas_euryale.AAC.3
MALTCSIGGRGCCRVCGQRSTGCGQGVDWLAGRGSMVAWPGAARQSLGQSLLAESTLERPAAPPPHAIKTPPSFTALHERLMALHMMNEDRVGAPCA